MQVLLIWHVTAEQAAVEIPGLIKGHNTINSVEFLPSSPPRAKLGVAVGSAEDFSPRNTPWVPSFCLSSAFIPHPEPGSLLLNLHWFLGTQVHVVWLVCSHVMDLLFWFWMSWGNSSIALHVSVQLKSRHKGYPPIILMGVHVSRTWCSVLESGVCHLWVTVSCPVISPMQLDDVVSVLTDVMLQRTVTSPLDDRLLHLECSACPLGMIACLGQFVEAGSFPALRLSSPLPHPHPPWMRYVRLAQ